MRCLAVSEVGGIIRRQRQKPGRLAINSRRFAATVCRRGSCGKNIVVNKSRLVRLPKRPAWRSRRQRGENHEINSPALPEPRRETTNQTNSTNAVREAEKHKGHQEHQDVREGIAKTRKCESTKRDGLSGFAQAAKNSQTRGHPGSLGE